MQGIGSTSDDDEDDMSASEADTSSLRTFIRAQLMALATSARDEKVRLGALERLDDQLGTVHEVEKKIDRVYGGSSSTSPTLSLALQQNVFGSENVGLLVESLKALAGGRVGSGSSTPSPSSSSSSPTSPAPSLTPSPKEPSHG